MNNFAVLDIAYSPAPATLPLSVETNNPCHLTCYYTDKEPGRHRTSRTDRGLTLPWGAYYCFVAWASVEQIEPEDTLTHTFEIPDWSYCQTKWFAFRGTVAEVLSPSVSCIFKYHHPGTRLLCNLGFEDWPDPTSIPRCWTLYSNDKGYPEIHREDTIVHSGSHAASLTSHGYRQSTGLDQRIYATPYQGKTVRFSAWLYGGYYGNPQVTFGQTGYGAWSHTRSFSPRLSWWRYTYTHSIHPQAGMVYLLPRIYATRVIPPTMITDDLNIEIV